MCIEPDGLHLEGDVHLRTVSIKVNNAVGNGKEYI